MANISQFFSGLVGAYGYLGVFFLMFIESANIPVPSEVVMPFGGFLASQGILNIWGVILAGTVANLLGSILSYFLAAKLDRFVKRSHGYLIARGWFEKYGEPSVFFSRILPIVRTFVSFPAGMFKMNLAKFSLFTGAGSLVWCAFLSFLGFYLGKEWTLIVPAFRQFDYLVVLAVGAAIGYLMWYHKKNHRRRHERKKEVSNR